MRKTEIKTALSSCKEQAKQIMSYIMKGLDEANIDYTTNKKETEIIVMNSSKEIVKDIVNGIGGFNSKINLVTITESKSNKKIYIRLKFL